MLRSSAGERSLRLFLKKRFAEDAFVKGIDLLKEESFGLCGEKTKEDLFHTARFWDILNKKLIFMVLTLF